MRTRTRFGDRLAVLGGARLDVLRVAPGARARQVALGGVLLSTGALAALSAAFAIHMTLGAWWAVAAVIGLGWGLVIINLDRMLLTGMSHDPSWKRNVAMALPRVALALVLGTVISTPLTLQVFSKEIDTTIVTMQAEAAQEFSQRLDADPRYAQIPVLSERIAESQAVLAGGRTADPNAAPAVVAAQAERDAKRAAYDAAVSRYDELQAKAQCELDGSCGSGRPGTGDAYFSAAAAAAQQASARDTARADLDDAEAALQRARTTAGEEAASADARGIALARTDLAADSAELTRMTEARNAEQAAFDAENGESDGILARLEAMDRLSEERPMVGAAHFMLFLLFLCIEVLPVLVKVLLAFAPPSAYDRLLEVRDDEEIEAEKIRVDGRQRAQRARADLVVAAETDRMAREILEREMAQREEAARKAARRRARRLPRTLRAIFPARDAAPAVPEVVEPTLDTGELEALLTGSYEPGMYGTGSRGVDSRSADAVRPQVPGPRPAADAVLAGADDTDR